MNIPSASYLLAAAQTCDLDGRTERAAMFRAQEEAYRPLRAMEKERIFAERAASTLRSAARIVPEMAEDLNRVAAVWAAEQKRLRVEIGSACAKIEAMRLP